MSDDVMNLCADMILANAIEDYAVEENISQSEARNRLLESKAYECLYDFDSRLWMEGSDYFLDFYRRGEQTDRTPQSNI